MGACVHSLVSHQDRLSVYGGMNGGAHPIARYVPNEETAAVKSNGEEGSQTEAASCMVRFVFPFRRYWNCGSHV